THRAQATGVDPRQGLLELPEVRRPHLMLADAGRDDRVAAGDGVEPLDEVLGLDRAVGVLGVGEGMGLLPVPQLCEPIGPLGRGALDATLGDPLDHRREDGPGVADDGDVRTAHLARSEEHTSELQSRENLVCRLLLEKKNNTNNLKATLFSIYNLSQWIQEDMEDKHHDQNKPNMSLMNGRVIRMQSFMNWM